MALPRQVADKIKEVEALEQQLSGEQPEPSAQPQEELEPEVKTPEAELPEVEEAPEVKEAPKAEKPEKPESQEEDAAVWRQKYKTLQGMYDAEVPRLHTQVKELTDKVSDLTKSLEEKKQQRKETEKLVTDEDVENFGEDLIEVQRKVAREVASQFEEELSALRTQNEELRAQFNTTKGEISESSFEAKLHRLVPDFAEVNASPEWVSWLDEVDPVLRAPRRVVAQQAFEAADADGVAYYIGMFKQQTAPVVEQPKVDTKKEELERQVQPSRTANASAELSKKGKNYSSAQIQQMFKKAAILSSTGKRDEANKLEAEIDAAYMEGRVTA